MTWLLTIVLTGATVQIGPDNGVTFIDAADCQSTAQFVEETYREYDPETFCVLILESTE